MVSLIIPITFNYNCLLYLHILTHTYILCTVVKLNSLLIPFSLLCISSGSGDTTWSQHPPSKRTSQSQSRASHSTEVGSHLPVSGDRHPPKPLWSSTPQTLPTCPRTTPSTSKTSSRTRRPRLSFCLRSNSVGHREPPLSHMTSRTSRPSPPRNELPYSRPAALWLWLSEILSTMEMCFNM